jgi:hypothetical protein
MPGGGGGSYVANGANYTTATPMIVAGGGGGSYSGGAGQGGQITNITTTGDGGGPVPGTNGNGAAGTTCGGGGGGFYTSGGNDTYQPTYGVGGAGFHQGGAGGISAGYGPGGFGGGATADYYGSCYMSAGAGGGYSGGSGYNSYSSNASGYGGGSYNIGTSQTNTAASNSGNGQVIISYSSITCSSVTRTPVTVTMSTPTAFTTQPSTVAQTICFSGPSTALFVVASPVTSYQWYSNTAASNTGGTLITGATTSSYTPLTTTAGTLYYYCMVSNAGCEIPSNISGAINVYPVNGIPILTGGISTLCYNASPGTFTATASGGDGTYTYLWYLGSVSTGITTQTYNPGNLILSTDVYCAVTSCGTTQNSVLFPISVITAPTIVTATPPTICPGGSSSLSATAAGFTFNWYDAASGGTLLGSSASGGNFVVSPLAQTTYYAESEYGVSGSLTFSYTGSITTWTVPAGVFSIDIDAQGAQGGDDNVSSPYYTGGLGARMQGTFTVTPGQVLSILVGQKPAPAHEPGGGGGTFVALGSNYATATPMIVAGGGGGAGGHNGNGANALITLDAAGPYGGTGGNGGIAAPCSGGGGGFYTNGAAGTTYSSGGGYAFQNGGAGGIAPQGGGTGGFGGGGAGDTPGSCDNGGSGGGYSGGGGNSGYAIGNGGSSYNGGTSQINTAGYTTGNGQVIISYSTPSCSSATRTPVTVYMSTPTAFSSQPSTVAQNVCLNGTATTLSVVASPVTSYQWYSNTTSSNTGGTLIAGATTSSYTPLATTVGTLYYYCMVSNSGCDIPSDISGGVIVHPANGIPTLLGASSNICYNTSPGTFTANGVDGDGTYTYLWYLGGVSTGITTQTYDPGNLISSTNIYCAVSSCGTTQNSASFAVTVISAPSLATATPSTICPGSSTSLSAISPGYSINWYDAATGGTLLGSSTSGGNFVVSPMITTTYYAESEYNGSGSQTFSYTGSLQTWTVPSGITSINIDAYGAQGGAGYGAPLAIPGLGGRVQATIPVTPGEVLNIYVGSAGGDGGTTIGGTGGYNGGGTGGGWSGGRSGGGGGGASDIRQGGIALSNRVIIAAGGGGTGVNHSAGDAGGNGGGLTGSNGLTGTYLGAGGTQTAGGTIGGGLGIGGNATAGQTGGGGGSGYYGGGGSAWEGGGGGSSYASPTATSVVHTAGARTGDGQITISYSTISCSSVTRTPVTVYMSTPTVFSTQPSTAVQNICLNGTATALTVVASPVTLYQWYSNTTSSNTGGTLIPGATTSTYTPPTTVLGTLYYYCVVSNSGCDIPSNVSGAINVYPYPSTPIITLVGYYLHSSATTGNQWYYSSNGVTYSAIPGATGQDYTFTQNGYYYVIVTTNGCSSPASNIINVVTTDVSTSNSGDAGLLIYPNPANDHITIETTLFVNNAIVSIYNIDGQLIALQAIQQEKTIIDISSFAKGVYVLKVKTNQKIAVNKFVKE